MQTIEECVKKIREAIYGKDVREAIAEGLEKAYEDANANVGIEVASARGSYDTLGTRMDALENTAETFSEVAEALNNRIIIATSAPETLVEGQICIVYDEEAVNG